MQCPHCGGLIDLVPAKPEADHRQAELPFVVELRHPSYSSKKVIDAQEQDFDTGARFDSTVSTDSFLLPSPEANRIESRRDRSASCEEGLIESIREIVGEKEFKLNAKLWRLYFQTSPQALRYALEDWKLRTPDQRRAIKNRAAWLTDRYKRAAEIKARAAATNKTRACDFR